MSLLSFIIPKWKRGNKSNINKTPITDGNVLVTTDTEEMYVDIDGKRLHVGRNNIVQCSQAEYDALPDTKLTDNKVYFIDDE